MSLNLRRGCLAPTCVKLNLMSIKVASQHNYNQSVWVRKQHSPHAEEKFVENISVIRNGWNEGLPGQLRTYISYLFGVEMLFLSCGDEFQTPEGSVFPWGF